MKNECDIFPRLRNDAKRACQELFKSRVCDEFDIENKIDI